ncbi:MAG: ATP-grasp domain-containing protein [Candidatus Omnitrophota bacterium]
MKLNERTRQIRERIGKRQLCWFGVRGIDADPLAKYGDLTHIYGQTAPSYKSLEIYEKSLESILMHRVDLNMYDVDFDQDIHTREFKRTVLFGVKKETVLVPYRPQEFLSSIYFTHGDIFHYYGLFHEFQRAFEHKPWVEKSIREAGINGIPWEYVRNIERDMVKGKIANGKAILIRPPYSSGGAGYAIIREIEDIYTNPVSASDDGFFSVAPFFEKSIPININACVYVDKCVGVFLPSFQLIGVKELTGRPLGYCGNDFGALKKLDKEIINQIEQITTQVGLWLAKKEYLGIFGLDLLVEGGKVYMVEINPRFQGSTMLSCKLAERIEDPDPYGEHMAAFMGMESPVVPPLWERVNRMEAMAQVVVYNSLPRDVHLNSREVDKLTEDYKGLPRNYVTVAPEGMIFKKIYFKSVTADGYKLFPEIATEITQVLSDIIR